MGSLIIIITYYRPGQLGDAARANLKQPLTGRYPQLAVTRERHRRRRLHWLHGCSLQCRCTGSRTNQAPAESAAYYQRRAPLWPAPDAGGWPADKRVEATVGTAWQSGQRPGGGRPAGKRQPPPTDRRANCRCQSGGPAATGGPSAVPRGRPPSAIRQRTRRDRGTHRSGRHVQWVECSPWSMWPPSPPDSPSLMSRPLDRRESARDRRVVVFF